MTSSSNSKSKFGRVWFLWFLSLKFARILQPGAASVSVKTFSSETRNSNSYLFVKRGRPRLCIALWVLIYLCGIIFKLFSQCLHHQGEMFDKTKNRARHCVWVLHCQCIKKLDTERINSSLFSIPFRFCPSLTRDLSETVKFCCSKGSMTCWFSDFFFQFWFSSVKVGTLPTFPSVLILSGTGMFSQIRLQPLVLQPASFPDGTVSFFDCLVFQSGNTVDYQPADAGGARELRSAPGSQRILLQPADLHGQRQSVPRSYLLLELLSLFCFQYQFAFWWPRVPTILFPCSPVFALWQMLHKSTTSPAKIKLS